MLKSSVWPWNTLYLGFPESRDRGLSGSELGTLLTFSVAAPVRDLRWYASSIFSTWINCPPSPRSAMNLYEKSAKVRVKLMSMFQCFIRDNEIKKVIPIKRAMRTWEWHHCILRCKCHCRVPAWSTGRSWNRENKRTQSPITSILRVRHKYNMPL